MNIYKEFLTTLLLIEITEIEIDTASFTFLLFYFFTYLLQVPPAHRAVRCKFKTMSLTLFLWCNCVKNIW